MFDLHSHWPRLTLLSLTALSLANHVQAEDSAVLDDVVVTASGFQQRARNASASISVVTQEQLAKKAYKDLTDALRDVPGVAITGGGSSSDISIRGMSSKYTMIMVDGRRVDSRGTRPNSDGAGIEQGWMPPIESIQRIEVIRGPMSALYGSDSMGGVINIITKKTTEGTQWRSSVRTEATFQDNRDSGDIFQTNVFTTGPIIPGLLGFRANAQINQRGEDAFLRGFKEQKTRNGAFTFTLTPTETDSIDFDFSRTIQERNGTVGKTIANGPRAENNDTRYQRTEYALTHKGTYDNVNTNNYVQYEKSDNPSRDMISELTTANSQTQFNLGNHSFSVGGQYRYEKLKDEGNTIDPSLSELTRWSAALFAQDDWRIVPNFTLTTALRVEKDENFGSHFAPKLYGVFTPSPSWTLKGGVSAGYKTPSLREVSPAWGQITGGGQSNGVIVGNPDLKPEKSLSTELGVSWDNLSGLSLGLTAYNNEFENKITSTYRCDGGSGNSGCDYLGKDYDFVQDRVNVDKATIRGAEATLDWQILTSLALSGSYTYTNSKQKSGAAEGYPLNDLAKHMVNTTLDWQARERLGLWARLNYTGKSSGIKESRVDALRAQNPAYTFVDIGLSYQPEKNVRLNAGVYNLFDKDVNYGTHRATYDGRRYHVGATYQF
ncbi:MAG: TonB-dependent receptor [Neisseriaceae bacterium]|nr:TonB-dependent receptor [Neisseriaceae bacterium]